MKEKDHNFRAARTLMVDCQVRPNNIVDDRIVTAMRSIRRERFVPADRAARAYGDAEIGLGHGRTMPSPLTIGKLAHFAAIRPGERVLVIGANTGYGTALLASCGGIVFALESSAALRAIATEALAAEAIDARVVAGRLAEGAPQHAPYDAIVIEGAIDRLPDSLAAQLTPTGRLIAILRQRGVGRIVRAQASGERFAHRMLADCHASLLSEFSPEPEFSFQ